MRIVKVNRKDIPNESKTPIFDYCRELIKNGEDLNSRLEIYRNPEYWDIAVDIGEGAKLTVREEPYARFQKYRLMSEKDKTRLNLKRSINLLGQTVERFKREG